MNRHHQSQSHTRARHVKCRLRHNHTNGAYHQNVGCNCRRQEYRVHA
ncbi:Uncharacterised protein [Vibrio cholerae]|nr:Uncharacterised protein [Vibrio cholerae]